MPRHLVLVGLPGSGKSVVGHQVAEALGAPLFDIDQLLVREMGMPVASIFGMVGEPRFREMEHKAVQAAVGAEEPAVIVPSRETGRSLLSDSVVVSPRTPSSWETTTGSPLRCGISTGTTSSSKTPFFQASAARWCDCAENASCSSRLRFWPAALQLSVRLIIAWSVNWSWSAS